MPFVLVLSFCKSLVNYSDNAIASIQSTFAEKPEGVDDCYDHGLNTNYLIVLTVYAR